MPAAQNSTRPLLPVSRAVDILPTPRSALPRYAAYVRARHRFWEAFPGVDGAGGAYVRLPTPGTDLECGFHALILSMRHQVCGGGGGEAEAEAEAEGRAAVLRVPTLDELRSVFGGAVVQGENARTAMGNGSWFTADQLAAVFAEWGRRFPVGKRCQMGWVMDRDEEVGVEGWPVMMNTPDVETGEVGEDIVRVWVWNDGGSLRGGLGHFEGIRRPTERELAAMKGRW
ncbi:hypothetical protein C7999DRAFT_43288 [Corynascus novoguineensis]|uniref:Uncharacterized protein n=1 Tax=Corynascus novoguineensis TaxID=1126955 RepID=A0AAN7CNT0_9PEZI|nr:hypothetical protein C7999DRAFT_43288 [Corynascus novoguineensis]